MTALAALGVSIVVAAGAITPASATPSTAKPATGAITGRVYRDHKDTGAYAAGEGLAKVTLTIFQETGGSQYTATTTSGSGGTFSFAHVPSGSYVLSGQAPGGWNVVLEFVTVRAAHTTPVTLRSVRPLGGALHARLTFDKRVYRVGQKAIVTITLHNVGRIALIGITAACNYIGDGDQLNAAGPGWGALAEEGAGVRLPAGKILTVRIPTTVPAAARQFGAYVADCDFGYSNVEESDRPMTHAVAAVPGDFGAVHVQVTENAHGLQGPGVDLAGARLLLVNTFGCPYIARGTTGKTGAYTFTHVPSGDVELYIYTPSGWMMPPANPTRGNVFGTGEARLFLQLVPGKAPASTPPSPVSIDCGKAAA